MSLPRFGPIGNAGDNSCHCIACLLQTLVAQADHPAIAIRECIGRPMLAKAGVARKKQGKARGKQ